MKRVCLLVVLLAVGCSGSSTSGTPKQRHVTVEVPIGPDDEPQTGEVRAGHQLFQPLAGHW